jgi:hypothetical protein
VASSTTPLLCLHNSCNWAQSLNHPPHAVMLLPEATTPPTLPPQVLLKELKGSDRIGTTVQFEASEVTDLPPRLRALVEDNKVRDTRGCGSCWKQNLPQD